MDVVLIYSIVGVESKNRSKFTEKSGIDKFMSTCQFRCY